MELGPRALELLLTCGILEKDSDRVTIDWDNVVHLENEGNKEERHALNLFYNQYLIQEGIAVDGRLSVPDKEVFVVFYGCNISRPGPSSGLFFTSKNYAEAYGLARHGLGFEVRKISTD